MLKPLIAPVFRPGPGEYQGEGLDEFIQVYGAELQPQVGDVRGEHARRTKSSYDQVFTRCQAGQVCTVYAFSNTVQSGLPSAKSTQHGLCNKCSLARSQ